MNCRKVGFLVETNGQEIEHVLNAVQYTLPLTLVGVVLHADMHTGIGLYQKSESRTSQSHYNSFTLNKHRRRCTGFVLQIEQFKSVIELQQFSMRMWWNGIHGISRGCCSQGLVGSSPTMRTKL
jgi:hypothetical protein